MGADPEERAPSVRVTERKRAAAVPLDDRLRATLAACIVSASGTTLAGLAAALGVSWSYSTTPSPDGGRCE